MTEAIRLVVEHPFEVIGVLLALGFAGNWIAVGIRGRGVTL